MSKPSGITWTNKSVLALAGKNDPILAVQKAARELVLKALVKGWEGPPFNPLYFAEMLNVQVAGNSNIADARLTQTNTGPRIEFNPQQARERVRFSIAHEVAHMLFPDWDQQIRNRGKRQRGEDSWQLEMLCNIAASELILPIGSLAPLKPIPPIEILMQERREFDVSAEAFFIRLVNISTDPIGMFVASSRAREFQLRKYRVNYFISSPTAPRVDIAGTEIPSDSAIYQCTAIGYTDAGIEKWITGDEIEIECVGIPAYSGNMYPRVATLVRFETVREGLQPVKYVHGNVLSPRGEGRKIVCQLVNDKATRWGGGVARKTATEFPDAERSFSKSMIKIPRDKRLGKVVFSNATDTITIASLIAQEGFGRSPIPRIRYNHLEKCMLEVAERALYDDASIHMPRIGTGSSGGDWGMVKEIVYNSMVREDLSITIYDPPPKKKQMELF